MIRWLRGAGTIGLESRCMRALWRSMLLLLQANSRLEVRLGETGIGWDGLIEWVTGVG
jgi:hypothetical protein